MIRRGLLAVPCTVCHAAPGTACIDDNGADARHVHTKRERAAYVALRAFCEMAVDGLGEICGHEAPGELKDKLTRNLYRHLAAKGAPRR